MKRLLIICLLSFLIASCTMTKNYSSTSSPEYAQPEEVYQVAAAPAPSADNTEYSNFTYSSGGGSLMDGPVTELSETDIKPKQLNKTQPVSSSFFPTTDVMAQLSEASFGYSVPKEANIDDTVEIEMIVNPSISITELTDQLQEGQKVSQKITISKIIEAKVTSSDFEITPITPNRQAVVGNQNTTWKWSLKPKSAGPNKQIKISVSAIVVVDGERTERYLETYTGKIKVNITTSQRIGKWLTSNWEWAWGSLLIPIGGFIWAYVTKKKKKKR